jgi:putative polyketide hydroxylase
VYLQRPRPYSVLLSHDAIRKHWVFFSTGYDPKRESIEDYYTDESESSSG